MANRKAVVGPHRKQSVGAPPTVPRSCHYSSSDFVENRPLAPHQMIHLYRDQADVLESHRHQDVQEWSGDLDDSRAQLIDQVQIDLLLR